MATRRSNNLVAVSIGQTTGLVISLVVLLIVAEPFPGAEAMAWSLLAGTSGSIGLFFFYLALSRGTMGLVAPATAVIGATIPALVGIARGDDVGPLILAGMIAALGAVVLISLPDSGTPVVAGDGGDRLREWLLISLAGLGFAGFFLGIAAAHDAGGAVWWPLTGVKIAGTMIGVGVTTALVLLGRAPPMTVPLAAVGLAILAGTGDLGGNLFFVLASGIGDLAVVVVLSSLYPVGTALLARFVLHERLGRIRSAGVALAMLGVVLIGLGSI